MNATQKANQLRRVRLSPYRKGMGPTFTLVTWDTGRTGYGKYIVGYRLTMNDSGAKSVLFEGEDFGCSPMHAIDSDETLAGIMGFLTLRPGDTDDDYFANYTPEQLAYCSKYAEYLSSEVENRFGQG
jgi:hypothetical protein